MIPPVIHHEYRVRAYAGGADFHLVSDWWSKHNNEFPFRETLLPPDGWIVERGGVPVAAAWLYLSAGIGVAFMDWVVTAPGQSPAESLEALRHIVGIAREYAKASNYGVIACHTFPALARYAKQAGFIETRTGLTQLMLET